ncbi:MULTISPECIES: heavy metal sensor histidine kinase [Pseudomonas syringae group genomosp. 2]|uniref:Sensor protein n=2 Tax=Pseudomonas syringae group genomosp. 2 TaxID=251698 RepID=A0A0Q0G1S8_PSEA0|nr:MULTISPECIES: heavy metal sensor histidine kinase [Pseudomonas syringae group genomosp. 2]EGH04541.1 heavy metal sensor histidine kinase [Pseudomonas amygdali pv. aesculi str. 0893_23]KPC44287.1 Heavy metal sensor histidine kinase [Pseudomonas amygdali pv. morsprunorum]KPW13744.1 Heavy metal sensor histidine kinase [Pseudomonas amygdali pv. aesculi]KPX84242.1 Heavy metal sensor histidine kinase [Pseudomonas meliae]KPZ06906.1 Heavy metal sensor histidine kinase [Pseudomonas amygdali pv. ulmi
MKPTRLSTRLGLTVTALIACLVLVMEMLAYAAISRQLDLRAEDSLNEKFAQIEHSMSEGFLGIEDIVQYPHTLRDQIIGHDSYSLMVLDAGNPRQQLMMVGNEEGRNLPVPEADHIPQGFQELQSVHGHKILMGYREIHLKTGQDILVRLSMDRESDSTLLHAYLKSTFLILPLILLLVGFGAWWVVRRGLRPLGAFRKVTALISARDLSHRMKVKGLPDELRDLAHAVNFMLHRLDGDVQQLAQFSDDLAHELRSPMNNLMGKAQVTLSRPRPSEEYKQALESCTEELERMSRMISQMLFLASVSQPAAPLPVEVIDLREEADKVAELFSSSAEERDITLQVQGNAKATGDRLMIQRAISNLLSNAIRHGLSGSVITITLATHADEVSLAVRNAGEGIDAEHLPRLFDRFYRVHVSRARQQGGTGLGLAIVRSIMSLHEGQVTVESEPGHFTTFSLIFPKLV